MNKYERDSFILGNTLNEFYKINSANLLAEINNLSANGSIYQLASSSEYYFSASCIININNSDYVVALYNLNYDLRLVVAKIDNLKENTLEELKRFCVLDIELDFSHQILSFIDSFKSKKDNDNDNDNKINSMNDFYNKYNYLKKSISSLNFSIQYLNSHIVYDFNLIEKILIALNINSENIIKIMKKEISEKIKLLENDIKEVFRNIPKNFKLCEPYYYGDADFSILSIPSNNDTFFVGYNNVVACDEYFMLLSKSNEDYSIRFDTFKNLTNMINYQELKSLNAFENETNIEIVKKLEPVIKIGENNFINTNDFNTIAFSLNSIAYSLLNNQPC